MSADFAGKTIMVTGAGNGIGREYALAFSGAGALTAVVDIDPVAAEATVKEIESRGGRGLASPADVADPDSVTDAVERISDALGEVVILINNAGLHLGNYNATTGLALDQWRRILEVNVLGALNCAVACRSSMARAGGGVIVNQSSMAAYLYGRGAYGVSKLALNGLTNALAADLAVDGIRVVGIAPGMISSPALLEGLAQERKEQILSGQLIKRFGEMQDLCGMVMFLCSDAASFITGQTFLVDGGYTARC
jgi:NAD(P)-dependent dehydrogenase (short-subunit alcohol dehydrogenase family)